MGTRKNRWGIVRGRKAHASVEKVEAKLSGRQFRRILKSLRIIFCRRRMQVPGSDWFLTQVIGSPFKFLVRHPRPRSKTRFKRQSNRRRQQQDNAQHQIEQNRFSLSVSNQLLVFLFRHCFRSSFFHVLFVSVCIFRFKNLALTTVIFTCLFFFCFCCVLFSSFLSALLSAFCFCFSPNFRHTFQIIFASYILKYNNRSFYHY